MSGVNLLDRDGSDAAALRQWYKGATLIDLLGTDRSSLSAQPTFDTPILDVLQPPTRDIVAPLRFPITNVFKGLGAGTGVSGRICSGVVQVGERLRILPGDKSVIVKCQFISMLRAVMYSSSLLSI